MLRPQLSDGAAAEMCKTNDPGKVGGPMLDLHIHDAHYIRLLFGMPTALTSRGRMRGEVVEYFSTQFEFDDPSLVAAAVEGLAFSRCSRPSAT